jgi:hypothetical protein
MGQISDMLEKDPALAIEGYVKPTPEPEKPIETEHKEPEKPVVPDKNIEPEKPKETVVPVDRLKIVSELFGENFDSEETATTTYRSLKEIKTEKEKLQKEYDELKAGVDPAGFFVNESEYHRQLLLKQFPQYDSELITRVVTKDTGKMDDLEAIRLYRKLKDSDIYQSDSQVDLLLKKELEIEGDEPIDLSQADETTKLIVRKLGKDAKMEFENIKKAVKIPDKINLEERKQKALKDQSGKEAKNKPLWEHALKDLPGKLDKMEFKYTDPETKQEVVVYTHEVEEGYRKEIEKAISKTAENMAKAGLEYSPKAEKEELAKFENALKLKYLKENVNKMMYALKKKTEKELSDKVHEEVDNPSKPNLQERPVVEKSATQQSKENLENDILKAHGKT